MDISKRVWNHVNRSGWPIDTPDHVLFARAAPEIGRHLHGDAWRNSDLTAVPIPTQTATLPVSLDSASVSDTERAWRLIHRAAPERPHPGFREIYGLSKLKPKPVLLSNEDWELARQLESESVVSNNLAAQAANAAYNRLQKLLEFLITELVWGRQIAAMKDHQENIRPVAAKLWNNRQTMPWLLLGKTPGVTNYDDWFSDKKPEYWLFLERSALAKLTSRACSALSSSANDAEGLFLSPYMQLAHDAIRFLGITAENQPKKAVIEQYLIEEWPKRGLTDEKGQVSNNLVEAIATIVRSKEKQVGRTGKNSKSSRMG